MDRGHLLTWGLIFQCHIFLPVCIQWTWTWGNFGKWWGTGRPGVLHGVTKRQTRLIDWTPTTNQGINDFLSLSNTVVDLLPRISRIESSSSRPSPWVFHILEFITKFTLNQAKAFLYSMQIFHFPDLHLQNIFTNFWSFSGKCQVGHRWKNSETESWKN